MSNFNFEAVFSSALKQANVRAVRTPRVQETTGVKITRNDLFTDEDKVSTRPVSKREVKNKSGRAGRRMRNNSKWVSAVGGTNDLVKAIYMPADAELCVVVDPRRGFLPDGTPNRNWKY